MELFKEIEEKYVETNGIKLHTVIAGSGEPIIMLHGFPEFWYTWRHTIMGLKDEYQCIAPDMRGYNLSDKPKGKSNYQLDILVEDIKGLSEALNLGEFYLAGHDWGAIIAWSFAEKYPDLVKKLIICKGPNIRAMRKTAEMDEKVQKIIQEATSFVETFAAPDADQKFIGNNFQLLRMMIRGAVKRKGAVSEFDVERYVEAWSQPRALDAELEYYRAMHADQDKFIEGYTGKVNVPTLVIHGMRDPAITPQTLKNLGNYVKDLKIVYVKKASHFVQVDSPEIVIKSIKEFIG